MRLQICALSQYVVEPNGAVGTVDSATVTYTNMVEVDGELAAALAEGVRTVDRYLGGDHPLRVGDSATFDDPQEQYSPADRSLSVGRFAYASSTDVDRAVEVAHRAYSSWSRVELAERLAVLRRAADLLEGRRYELTALLMREAGKPTLEALAEVDEAPLLIRIYCDAIESADGYRVPMPSSGPGQTNLSLLRPYGVWSVISPFNFPLALATGPSSAALIAGNTVVLKPSPAGQLTATVLRDVLLEAGVPVDAITLIYGDGPAGSQLIGHRHTAGVTFTGSYRVGSEIIRSLAGGGQPVICEMGGKNPAVVTASADLGVAAEGVMRAAFGYSGQKCSSCSRVLVHDSVFDEFRDRVVALTEECRVGDPVTSDPFTGPVIAKASVERYEACIADLQDGPERVLVGGHRLTADGLDRGNYVAPTVVLAGESSKLWRDELFLPIVAIDSFTRFSDAISRANDTEFGLTAGIFSQESSEVDQFADEVNASVIYANRRAGATTGAWPGMQPISGWKHSGNTGRGTGGPYYLQQYLREQARAIEI